MATSGTNTIDFENVLETPDAFAGQIMSLWHQWKSARTLSESRWAETKKYVFATSTRETTNAQNPWDNTVHRPKLYHIYNNLLVNTDFSLFPKADWLEFISYDQQSDSKAKRDAALAYLRTKHRLSGFRQTMRKLEADWLLYGNCFSGLEYVQRRPLIPLPGRWFLLSKALGLIVSLLMTLYLMQLVQPLRKYQRSLSPTSLWGRSN